MGVTRRLTLFLKRHNIDDWTAPRWIYHHVVQPILRRLYLEAVVAISGGPEEFQLLAFKALVHRGDVVVDLGANVGYYTLPAAEAVGPQGRVFAFEPEPSNCALLRRLITPMSGRTPVLGSALRRHPHRVPADHYRLPQLGFPFGQTQAQGMPQTPLPEQPTPTQSSCPAAVSARGRLPVHLLAHLHVPVSAAPSPDL